MKQNADLAQSLQDRGIEHVKIGVVDTDAAAAERYGETLVSEGMFSDASGLAAFAGDFRALQNNPADGALLWKHGLGPSMRNEALRLLEIRNWLDAQVLQRTQRRG